MGQHTDHHFVITNYTAEPACRMGTVCRSEILMHKLTRKCLSMSRYQLSQSMFQSRKPFFLLTGRKDQNKTSNLEFRFRASHQLYFQFRNRLLLVEQVSFCFFLFCNSFTANKLYYWCSFLPRSVSPEKAEQTKLSVQGTLYGVRIRENLTVNEEVLRCPVSRWKTLCQWHHMMPWGQWMG